MKPYLLLCALGLASAYGQTAREWTLPATAAVKTEGPQSYRFTCDYYQLDRQGRIGGVQRLSGRYTRDLPGDVAKWNDVTAATGRSVESLGPAQKREFMDGFSYPHAAKDALKSEFFKNFPPTAMQERNLVWDTAMFEAFGETLFGNLKLNTPYHMPSEGDVPLAGTGTFQNKDVQLVWSGLSKRDGEECALVDYRAFFNTLNVKTGGLSLIGRSHYWGQIWVSLATLRIVYGTLYEDVGGEITLPGQEKAQPMDVFRIGVFEREKK